jgi:hypothetical protein
LESAPSCVQNIGAGEVGRVAAQDFAPRKVEEVRCGVHGVVLHSGDHIVAGLLEPEAEPTGT